MINVEIIMVDPLMVLPDRVEYVFAVVEKKGTTRVLPIAVEKASCVVKRLDVMILELFCKRLVVSVLPKSVE
jgi:hypothetical protein